MQAILKTLGIAPVNSGAYGAGWLSAPGGAEIASINPASGATIAKVKTASAADYETIVAAAQAAFAAWRMVPAPRRGELVRQLGEALREKKEPLGQLVTLEVGKIAAEGLGEVQEMVDICDFATGLSRQLYGLTMHSERPRHRMYEQWHPIGPVGIISAFNFPVAVWSWNAAIAAVCGDACIWKPSEKAPLTAIAVQKICEQVTRDFGAPGIFTLAVGADRALGEAMAADKRLPVVSATGSVRMGKSVGQAVAARLGRVLLELGGNNAIVIAPDADLDLALRGVLFGAVGTAGQRCTSTRRLFLHQSIAKTFTDKLVAAYKQVTIGDPLDPGTLMGPLIDAAAVEQMQRALAQVQAQGGAVIYGGKRLDRPGYFVEPALVRARAEMPLCQEETFAPILYLIEYDDFAQALRWHNDVPQGLSSAVFTRDLITAETFLSHEGSDCGIANVNLGTSGAEIGGAFGGEKETGGGREAGSDAWKAYMRRQTNTLNWSPELPLAQGIKFG